MDRLTGKDAKLMMEALASVYLKEEVDQEVISEEVERLTLKKFVDEIKSISC